MSQRRAVSGRAAMSQRRAMSGKTVMSGRRAMSRRLALLLATSLSLVAGGVLAAEDPEARALVVGSKNFTEGVVLGELVRALGSTGSPAEHRQALGGTRLVFNALVSGEIDIYAEYTGTLTQEILAQQQPESREEIREILAESHPEGVATAWRALGKEVWALGSGGTCWRSAKPSKVSAPRDAKSSKSSKTTQEDPNVLKPRTRTLYRYKRYWI